MWVSRGVRELCRILILRLFRVFLCRVSDFSQCRVYGVRVQGSGLRAYGCRFGGVQGSGF